MTLSLARRLLPAVAVLTAVAGPAFGQSGLRPAPAARATDARPTPPPGPPWWKDEQFKRDLGLTSDESLHIDAVFQQTMPQLRQGYQELDKSENKLSHMIETNADEALVVRQIDRIEEIRSNLNKARTLMHLHMRQVLTPEQRLRFTALYEKRQSDQQQQQQSTKRQDH